MTRGILTTIALAAAVLTAAATAGAAPLAWGGKQDIGALMALADEHFDLEKTDAVFLLDGLSVSFHEDGTRETAVHRIVWISTELATDEYADLRVPYDTTTSTLTVHALRTWRDGRWWPDESKLSPTAIVETTPSALIAADDYTTIREAALLHDGVEIPCVLETAYTITEARDPDAGADGLWILPNTYPSVRVERSITLPGEATLRHRERNGAPTPQTTVEGEPRRTYRWTADVVDRRKRPLTDDPALYEPRIEWSTWETRGAHAEAVVAALEDAMILSDALKDTVAGLIEHEPVDLAKARAVADYVNDSTRSVHYDDSFWELKPRTATRTWETAYGHRLDRAVLAAALFREAGLRILFTYRSRGYVEGFGDDLLGTGSLEGVGVWITGNGVDAYYDPESGVLDVGESDLHGRRLWFLGDLSRVFVNVSGGLVANTYELIVTLEPANEEGYGGSGFVNIRGGLAPYDRAVGLDGECAGYLEQVAHAVAAGATLTEHGVIRMDRDQVVAGFEFDVEAPEPDDRGRIELAVGDPPGGVLDRLPGDAHLYDAERGSPLALFGPMRQRVTFRVKTAGQEVVRVPEPRSIENAVGRFSVSVEEEDGWTSVTRELAVGPSQAGAETRELGATVIAPDEWPLLRELLLEETERTNRSVFLR
jgi:hypothetical protein